MLFCTGFFLSFQKKTKLIKKREEILGKQFFDKYKKKQDMLQLDQSLDNFERKCFITSEIVVNKGHFLGFMKGLVNFDM